jgi:hypothetical protein
VQNKTEPWGKLSCGKDITALITNGLQNVVRFKRTG